MRENNSPLEHLELVHEMNRLFLGFLQGRAQRGGDCLGLAAPICELLRAATDAQLDRAAALPRALFRLDITIDGIAERALGQASNELLALYSLQSKLLLSARNLSRQNAHLAQAFLGLSARALIRLRSLVLVDLVSLAETACLLAAGFDDEPWLWQDLFCCETALEQRRLRLIVLQPRAGDMNVAAVSGPRRLR